MTTTAPVETGQSAAEPRAASSTTRWLGAALIAGFVIRLLLAPLGDFRGDATTFASWADRLLQVPLADFYASGRPIDHLPGDLWLLWALAKVDQLVAPGLDVHGSSFFFLLKIAPALADVGIGAMLFLIARRLVSPRLGLLAAACWLFNPASIYLTSIWGQWDSVSAFFVVAALWMVLGENPAWALPFLTYAGLIKPQLALLFPLVAIAWWQQRTATLSPHPEGEGIAPVFAPALHRIARSAAETAAHKRVILSAASEGSVFAPGRILRFAQNDTVHQSVPGGGLGSLRGQVRVTLLPVLTSIVVFFAVDLPFNVGLPLLPTRWTIFGRAGVALNTHTDTTANAFNLWELIGGGRGQGIPDSGRFLLGLSYQTWGMALLVGAVVFALARFWRRPSRLMALWAALAITFAAFMLPTRIHERYLLPAVVLAVLLAVLVPRFRWIAAGLSLTYLVNLTQVYAASGGGGFGRGGFRPEAFHRSGFPAGYHAGSPGGFHTGFPAPPVQPTGSHADLIPLAVAGLNLALFVAVLAMGMSASWRREAA